MIDITLDRVEYPLNYSREKQLIPKLAKTNVYNINNSNKKDVLPWQHILYIHASGVHSEEANAILKAISQDPQFLSKSDYPEFFELWEYQRTP